MDGFRLTESGDLRVIESGDTRITENFVEAFATFSASASVSAQASFSVFVSSSLSSEGSTMLVGLSTLFGRAGLFVDSALASEGARTAPVASSLLIASDLQAVALRTRPASFAAQASGLAEFNGAYRIYVTFAVQASGAIVAFAKRARSADFRAFSIDAIRITEDGDIRVTEDGVQRFAPNALFNLSEGFLASDPNLILFDSDLSVKYLGQWKNAASYVKVGGEWVEPEKAYMKISGAWKRIA